MVIDIKATIIDSPWRVNVNAIRDIVAYCNKALPNTFLVFSLASLVLGAGVVSLSITANRTDNAGPKHLIIGLRLAQYSALLLVLQAGLFLGLVLLNTDTIGTGFDVALTVGFFAVAGITMTLTPRQALTTLACTWFIHSVVTLLRLAPLVAGTTVPDWYPSAAAIYDLVLSGFCYLPVLRRREEYSDASN